MFQLGPARVTIGDVFAIPAAAGTWTAVDRLIAWPRTLPTDAVDRRDRWGGLQRARTGLSEDPTRFVGIRPYQPGDPIRRLHVRASARLGHPVVKRFEPSRDPDTLLVVDIEPRDAGAPKEQRSDAVEERIVVAASLVRALGLERAPFGIAAAGYARMPSRLAYLPVSSAPAQVERGLDLLARLSVEPSATFDVLVGFLARVAREATTILVVTERDDDRLLGPLRALAHRGFAVQLLAVGPSAPTTVARARAIGLDARSVALDGTWSSATRMRVVA